MRYILSWLLFVQVGLSKPYTNNKDPEPQRAPQDDVSKLETPTLPTDQNSTPLEQKGETTSPGLVDERDDPPTDTKTYSVWVTDRNNEDQIKETRKWLENLVKDKSKMTERVSFVWEKPEDVPDEELQKLWDEGRYDEEISKYDRTDGWFGLVLDSAGFEEVSKKTEWISDIDDQTRWRVHSFSESLELRSSIPATLKSRADEPETKKYIVWVTDSENIPQIDATREWLSGIVKNKTAMTEQTSFPWVEEKDIPAKELEKLWDEGRYDQEIDKYQRVDCWSDVELDAAGYDMVSKKKEWIRDVSEYMNVVEMIAVKRPDIKAPEKVAKRDFSWGEWDKQVDAYRDLVQESRYDGSDFANMKDFVFEKNAGKGTKVYVIDSGVAVDVKKDKDGKVPLFKGFADETGDDKSDILYTRNFMNQNDPHDIRWDHSPGDHGTMVASKAVGQWGTAKEAMLVPVQVKRGDSYDAVQGFEEVFKHLMRTRSLKKIQWPDAVVVMSKGADLPLKEDGSGLTREEAEKLTIGSDLKKKMLQVLNLGVPIVLSSGNFGDQPKREVIDAIPQVLENEDFPVINIGATTHEGVPLVESQGKGTQDGTQLTMYAVGENVDCHNAVDGPDGETVASGTSIAAPAVAGIIAVHMKYKPWDQSKTGIDKVKEIKRWLRTEESSWERVKNEDSKIEQKMIWNGADQQAHGSTQSTTTQPQPAPPAPAPEPQNEGQTLVIGLQQDAYPNCNTVNSPQPNQVPSTYCQTTPLFTNSYFFYRLDHIAEVDSLCKTPLTDYSPSDQGKTKDENLFEHPTWPSGQWTLTLNGEQFTYMNNGENPGALWKGDQRIDCGGDLTQHDPKSDELCFSGLTKSDGHNMKRRRLVQCSW